MIRGGDGFQSTDDNISLSLRDVPKTPAIGSRVRTLPVLDRGSPLASSPVRGENQTLVPLTRPLLSFGLPTFVDPFT